MVENILNSIDKELNDNEVRFSLLFMFLYEQIQFIIDTKFNDIKEELSYQQLRIINQRSSIQLLKDANKFDDALIIIEKLVSSTMKQSKKLRDSGEEDNYFIRGFDLVYKKYNKLIENLVKDCINIIINN